ncbi:hypothetical protein C8R44DRAFT_884981 [Mycena epipterygia]|nr:hypothetical protein C8R44DRAFT_884981 [Mycena epipterygia]
MGLIILIPEHIVLKTSPISGGDHIHLLSADAFDAHWVPQTQRTWRLHLGPLVKIQKRSTFSDPAAWSGLDQNGGVREYPRDNTHRVRGTPYNSSTCTCYKLVVAPGQHPSWAKWTLCFEDPSVYEHIFYSGNTMGHAGERHRIVPPTKTRGYEDLELADYGDRISTIPYSGAVTLDIRALILSHLTHSATVFDFAFSDESTNFCLKFETSTIRHCCQGAPARFTARHRRPAITISVIPIIISVITSAQRDVD